MKEKASQLWDKIPQFNGKIKPAFSSGWLDSFKRRRGIKSFTLHGEAGSVNLADVEEYMKELRIICQGFLSQDIYNMDESALFWKLTPSKTLVTQQQAGRKHEKARITAIFYTNADGTDKFKITLIGTSEKPRCFINAKIKKESLPYTWLSNKTAWNTTEYMLGWLMSFYEHVKARKRHTLFLMDNFSAHEAAMRFLIDEGNGREQPLLPWLRVE